MQRLSPQTLIHPRTHGADRAPAGKRALVVGGGIAGVAAATILAERGVQVTLLEREAQLGGRAGGFPVTLAGGERLDMERGFHAFFRQYYNLHALLRRIDPTLSLLRPLQDYPILGPEGQVQSFRGLPKRTPLQIMALVARTPYLGLSDLAHVNGPAALHMLAYDADSTYRRFDGMSAGAYLDSLGFPETARRMLFDVFAHSFFNPESDMSAAELLMMFHFYFTGNPEGLIFDVPTRPLSKAIWEPFARHLGALGVELQLGTGVRRVERLGDGFRVHHDAGQHDGDMMVLSLDVGGLQRVVDASPDLGALRTGVGALGVTRPFAVWRLWLDRPVNDSRAPFAGTTGVGLLDNISVYEKLQDESRAWADAHGGSVIELHAYGVPPTLSESEVRADLLRGLHRLYPETRPARVLDERFLWRQDCPRFAVGDHAGRPGVETPIPGLTLAGDGIAVPVPCALMERATVSGMLAANTLLSPLGVRSEPIRSIPTRGLFSRPQLVRRPRAA